LATVRTVFSLITIFAGSGRLIRCDLRYVAKTMEYALGPESMTFIGFIVLLTLRCIGRHCPSDGAGASERSITLVKADATPNPG